MAKTQKKTAEKAAGSTTKAVGGKIETLKKSWFLTEPISRKLAKMLNFL